MKLSKALEDLSNIWHTILFADGDQVQILKDGVVVDSHEFEDVNDDEEVANFIMAFVNS